MTKFINLIRKEVFPTPFCPGCGSGILMNALLRAMMELELNIDRTLFVSGIGCSAWIPSPHFAADTLHTLHGRALAYATGAKLSRPDLTVIVVSGDGDLSSIGGNHLIHSARRNIDITTICANNMIYGMTGGQVASTTPLRARSSTTPGGNPWPPFDLCKLVKAAGATYVARYPVSKPRLLSRAIVRGIRHEGFAFIEAISTCPTQFGRRNAMRSPVEMIRRLDEMSVSKKEAEKMSPAELEGKVVYGEFGDETD